MPIRFGLVLKAIVSGTSRKLAAQAEIPNDFLEESFAEGPIHATTILAKPSFQFRIRHFENPISTQTIEGLMRITIAELRKNKR
jgi:hypothetical protein